MSRATRGGRKNGAGLPPPPRRWLRDGLLFAALASAVALAYQPVWQAGFVLDDDAHVTAAKLRSLEGLGRIWWDVTATQQYYPLTESLFWFQHRLWADWSPGYHLVNIALHALTAILAIVFLRRLGVPGAPLAGALFALHPVHVATVAWVTEQKNTLSAVFYLAAAIAYLRFDETRGLRLYLAAFGLFFLAVLSKIVTVTLPPAVLLALWWQRGTISWRRDVRPLVPFFAVSLGMGLLLTWLERTHVGAQGDDFAFTFGERFLLPGRIILFYLGKLLWPSDLRFVYPRWNLAEPSWWPWACWAVVLTGLAAAWAIRRRIRGPLAGLLFFIGTLLPVLGFLNVYWFVFSFVGDHLQYLASLGIISLVAAGVWLLTERWPRLRPAVTILGGIALLALAGLTWRNSSMFRDVDTFYETIIAENPGCWQAHNNLGLVFMGRGRPEEAIRHYEQAIKADPECAMAHNNLGLALVEQGNPEQAISSFRRALEIAPGFEKARVSLSWSLWMIGKEDDAEREVRKVLEINPDNSMANNNLGWLLASRGMTGEAILHYERAIEADPESALAHNNLGVALAERGDRKQAILSFRKALEIDPGFEKARLNLEDALAGDAAGDPKPSVAP